MYEFVFQLLLSFSHLVISWLFATPWTAARQASLSFTISQDLPKFMSIALVMPPSHLILWCPLLLLPSVFPRTRNFSNVSAVCIRWPEYWIFSFRISLSKEYSGLISLKFGWLDLPPVQGTLRSFLQHHILRNQLVGVLPFLWSSSYNHTWPLGRLQPDYMALCRHMSLFFITLSRFVIAFLPRSNFLLVSWLQSPSTVILEPKKRKYVFTSTFPPSICREVMGSRPLWQNVKRN